MTLVEFLEARLAEDEAVARAAIRDVIDSVSREVESGDGIWTAGTAYDERQVQGIDILIYDEGSHSAEQAQHIARHDPARVLREVEAKRTIVAEHRPYHVTTRNDGLDWDYKRCVECTPPDDLPIDASYYPCLTLCRLASIYFEHPDYNQEWAL
jgi:hypothetical protein